MNPDFPQRSQRLAGVSAHRLTLISKAEHVRFTCSQFFPTPSSPAAPSAAQCPHHGVPTLEPGRTPQLSDELALSFSCFPVWCPPEMLPARSGSSPPAPARLRHSCSACTSCFSKNPSPCLWEHLCLLYQLLPAKNMGCTAGWQSRQRLWEKGLPWLAMPSGRREGEVLGNLPWINRKMKARDDLCSAGTCRPNPNSSHVSFSWLLPCLGNLWNPGDMVAVLYHFQVHNTLPEPHGEKDLENQPGPCWNSFSIHQCMHLISCLLVFSLSLDMFVRNLRRLHVLWPPRLLKPWNNCHNFVLYIFFPSLSKETSKEMSHLLNYQSQSFLFSRKSENRPSGMGSMPHTWL